MVRLGKISSLMLLCVSLAQAQWTPSMGFFTDSTASTPGNADLGFRYKSCTMGTSVTSTNAQMVTVTIDTAGVYLFRAFGVSDNLTRTIDSCYILSNNLGTKKSLTTMPNIGVLVDYEIKDTLSVGTYYVRFKWNGTADLAAGVALYRGPASSASSGNDTTSTDGPTASFTPTSSAGDSLLMAVNGYSYSLALGTGVTQIGTVNYYSGSRALKIFQKTSSGNSQIRVDFDNGGFNSCVTVIKKP